MSRLRRLFPRLLRWLRLRMVAVPVLQSLAPLSRHRQPNVDQLIAAERVRKREVERLQSQRVLELRVRGLRLLSACRFRRCTRIICARLSSLRPLLAEHAQLLHARRALLLRSRHARGRATDVKRGLWAAFEREASSQTNYEKRSDKQE